MATLLIIRRWVICRKCWTLQRLTPAPKYFCRRCGNPVNTLEEVTQMLRRKRFESKLTHYPAGRGWAGWAAGRGWAALGGWAAGRGWAAAGLLLLATAATAAITGCPSLSGTTSARATSGVPGSLRPMNQAGDRALRPSRRS